MNYDRFLTRVFDKEKGIMSYPGDSIYFYPDCERLISNLWANKKLDDAEWALGEYLGIFKEKLMVKFGGDVFLLPDIENRFIPMQCMGLRDVNEFLIYKDDIITNKYIKIYPDQTYIKYVVKFDRENNLFFGEYSVKDVIIIGNRWENPELLEEINDS